MLVRSRPGINQISTPDFSSGSPEALPGQWVPSGGASVFSLSRHFPQGGERALLVEEGDPNEEEPGGLVEESWLWRGGR